MCDTSFSSSFPATYTGIDIANANKYATMKLYKKKMDDYNNNTENKSKSEKPLEWVHRYPGGKETSYPCDMNNKNLSCLDGSIRITSRKECESKSRYKYDPERPDDNFPSPQKGMYLQWLPPSSIVKTESGLKRNWDISNDANGDCYAGNYIYRTQCDTSFSDLSQPIPEHVRNKLHFNQQTGQCMISRDYCQGTGFNKYIGPNGVEHSNLDGGMCELSGPQKFADFLGGNTFARGINGGACHFMHDTPIGKILNSGNT